MLNNKYIVLLLVIVLAAIVIVLVQLTGGETPPSIVVPPKNYEELKTEIESLKGKKWNKSTFGSLGEMVGDFQEKKLITQKQTEDLRELLVSNYLVLLTDSVQHFCATGSNMTDFERLAKEVSLFQQSHKGASSTAQRWIDQYRKVLGLIGVTNGYTSSQAWNSTISESYKNELASYQTMTYIGDNTYIQTQIDQALKKIPIHQKIAKLFEVKRNRLTEDDCRDFNESAYYTNLCKEMTKKKENVLEDSIR